MRHPFKRKGRSGWHAEYKFAKGDKLCHSFDTHEEAASWLLEQEAQDKAEQGPKFGGPSRVTLGQFLGEYAAQFSITKHGFQSEFDRVNHYVTAVGLPRMKVKVDANGHKSVLMLTGDQTLPSAFQAHKDARLAHRKQTYAWIATLARKKVSKVSRDDIRELMTRGHCEGWEDSTIQKEIALLKAAFNSAITIWGWKGFENPCTGLRLGKSNSRFVVMAEEGMARLVKALSECDNPQFWPLVDMAIHTTLREGSLLSMKWSQTNLETRRAKVWAKGRWHHAQLPLRAIEILKSMPRGESDNVFTMTQNGVNMAWEGVREKAELPGMTFMDLRHVGATAYAKAGLSAHALMHLLGHTTTRMAETYVNLARSDVLRALDEVDAKVAPMTPTPPPAAAPPATAAAATGRPVRAPAAPAPPRPVSATRARSSAGSSATARRPRPAQRRSRLGVWGGGERVGHGALFVGTAGHWRDVIEAASQALASPHRRVPAHPSASIAGRRAGPLLGEAKTMEPIMIALAFAAGFAAQLVKLPPLIGFLAAGFILNALGFEKSAALDTIANLGVTLLLFTIGLKLDIRTLLRGEVWGSATLHIVGSTLLLAGVLFVLKMAGLALAADLGWTAMVLLGFALSFSSTVFAVKVLEDRSELNSLYGRIAIGILVMQDVFAVVFLAASTGQLPSPWALALVLLWPAGKLMKLMLDRVGHGDLQVLYGAFLSLVVGYGLFEAVGVKGDLGALVIGMMLASHPATAGLAKSLFHLKELFLVGFFLSVGLGALPDLSMALMALLLLAVLPLKSALYHVVLMRFGLRTRTGVLATLSLTNYSEFGLIVAAIAAQAGWLSAEWLVVISLALAGSFVLAAPLNAASERLYGRLKAPLAGLQRGALLAADRPIDIGEVDAVVLGMGRIGSGAHLRLTQAHGLKVLGVDNDPAQLVEHRAAGRHVIEGDAVDSDFWDKLVLPGPLKLVLLAMPSHAGNVFALQQLQHRAFAGRIAAIVEYPEEVELLRGLGAHAVFHISDEAGSAFADDAMAALKAA